MDRTINVTVNGSFVRKDSKNAGVQGEANVTGLHIVMSGDWEAFSKRVIWRDAQGENPVVVLLYSSVEDLAAGKDPLVFDTPIPAEPLALAGWCSFTIEGFRDSDPTAVSITVTDTLLVKPNDAYNAPAEPTPSQAQQLQAELDEIVPQVTEWVNRAIELGIPGGERRLEEEVAKQVGTLTNSMVKNYYLRFRAEDFSAGKLTVPASTHGLGTARSILSYTLHMLVRRSALDFTEADLAEAEERFIEMVAAALETNTATPGTYPTAADGHVQLTWTQTQYYLLEQSLVSDDEALEQAEALGFDWQDIDTSGTEETVSLDELLTAAYTPALGGASTTLDTLWTADVLNGLRLRRAVEGVTGVSKKYDCVGYMSSRAWGLMEADVRLDTGTGALILSSELPFDGEMLVLAGG